MMGAADFMRARRRGPKCYRAALACSNGNCRACSGCPAQQKAEPSIDPWHVGNHRSLSSSPGSAPPQKATCSPAKRSVSLRQGVNWQNSVSEPRKRVSNSRNSRITSRKRVFGEQNLLFDPLPPRSNGQILLFIPRNSRNEPRKRRNDPFLGSFLVPGKPYDEGERPPRHPHGNRDSGCRSHLTQKMTHGRT